ncbi:MAG: DUF1826 domain-containing protein [Neomegalonema sp.]|nr:DUF1826 domain-containing protein [Neomegalonema sp.]
MATFSPQDLDIIDGEVASGTTSEILESIQRRDTVLAIWHRSLEPAFLQWLSGLPSSQLPQARFTAPRLQIGQHVSEACARLAEGAHKQAMIDDLTALIDQFSAIMSAPVLRVRLEAVEGNACRRFHQDVVSARMLCTYRGPGTEWGFADQGETPQAIKAVSTGEVAICKGSMWPDAPAHRLVHRSPPIDGTGVVRCLLVVDAADPEGDAEWVASGRR